MAIENPPLKNDSKKAEQSGETLKPVLLAALADYKRHIRYRIMTKAM